MLTVLCLRKTQFALEYAFHCNKSTPSSVIYWIHANSHASFVQGYREIAKRAVLGEMFDSVVDLLNAVKHWVEKQSNWLMVLDNADELKLFAGYDSATQNQQEQQPKLFDFIPKGDKGTVLWTTRDGAIKTLLGPEHCVELGVMSGEESWKLFHSRAGVANMEPSKDDGKLLELLENLPLAIVQAAAYISETNTTVSEYITLFTESPEQEVELLDQEFLDQHRTGETNSVMRTWQISMVRIAEDSPCAAQILRTVCFYDSKRIPMILLSQAGTPFSKVQIAKGRTKLEQFSFLQASTSTAYSSDLYEQHRLVNLATRQSLSKEQFLKFSKDALHIIAKLFPSGDYGTWDECSMYLPHATKVLDFVSTKQSGYGDQNPDLRSQEVLDLLGHIAGYYHEQQWSSQAEGLQIQILNSRMELSGARDPDTMLAMANLAFTRRNLGRYTEAELLETKVLQMRKEVLGPKHADTILAMANLADTKYRLGQITKAEELETEVLALNKEILGEMHPDTILAMGNLAVTKRKLGLFDDAELLETSVIDLRREVLGEKHPDTILALGNLASTRRVRGRYEEAEPLDIKVLELRKEVLGPRHPDTILTMGNLASTRRHLGRYEEAEVIEIEVLGLRKEILGSRHPDTILTMANLALTRGGLGLFEEAEILETEVLALRKEVLGIEHPDTVQAMESLATTRGRQGKKENTLERIQVSNVDAEDGQSKALCGELSVEPSTSEQAPSSKENAGLSQRDQLAARSERYHSHDTSSSVPPVVISKEKNRHCISLKLRKIFSSRT